MGNKQTDNDHEFEPLCMEDTSNNHGHAHAHAHDYDHRYLEETMSAN
jgi:hypothetical protein